MEKDGPDGPKPSSKMAESRAHLGEIQRRRSREAIIDAAFQVFQEKTPDAAVIGDFISAAGVARGTFYNHFKDVDDVCSAVALRLVEEFGATVLAAVSDMPDPAERIAASMRHYLHRAAREPKWGWVIVRVAMHGALAKHFVAATVPNLTSGRECGRLLPLTDQVGLDLLTGAANAAMLSAVQGRAIPGHVEAVVAGVMRALGVSHEDALEIVSRPMPPLPEHIREQGDEVAD